MRRTFKFKNRTFETVRMTWFTYVGLDGYVVARAHAAKNAIAVAKEQFSMLGDRCKTSHKLPIPLKQIS